MNTKIEAKKSEQGAKVACSLAVHGISFPCFPGKQVAQQRTLILKLKQAVGELLNKRDHFLVAVSEREEGFQLREMAGKEQVRGPAPARSGRMRRPCCGG